MTDGEAIVSLVIGLSIFSAATIVYLWAIRAIIGLFKS